MENDYSQAEVNNTIEELTTVHISKLKQEELAFLSGLTVIKHEVKPKITQEERDTLIKLYDAIGEAGY